MTESEVWNDVVGYEGFYKVSNKGNVHSVERKDSMGRKIGGRTLQPSSGTSGYPQVILCKNGVQKTKSIHRLVAEAFMPNPNNLPEINHLDEVKDNNELPNLEWCTSKHNSNHGTLIERLGKKVRAVNIETGEVITFSSIKEAGRKGYSRVHVSRACRGVYNTGGGNLYRGYEWSYMEVE